MQVHEKSGELLASWLRGWNPEQITPAEFGELAIMRLVGCTWLAGLLTSLRISHNRALAHSLIIAFLAFATAGFGVLVDLFDEWGTHREVVTFVANFVEDGGELVLIASTLIVVCAIFDLENARAARLTAADASFGTTSASD